MDLGANQLQDGQPAIRGDGQLIDLDQTLIQLAGGFADVGLGQIGDPVRDAFLAGVGKAQLAQRLLGHTQIQGVGSVVHNRSSFLPL